MNWLIPIVSAILYRLDGVGKGDSFLPFKPFTIDSWKIGGINYARYAIGLVIALLTHNFAYLVTYSIAVSVPYGENSLLDRFFGPYKWFIIGALFGGASLSWGMALWLGMVSLITKYLDIDHAVWECGIMGFLGTIIYIWR